MSKPNVGSPNGVRGSLKRTGAIGLGLFYGLATAFLGLRQHRSGLGECEQLAVDQDLGIAGVLRYLNEPFDIESEVAKACDESVVINLAV